MPKPLKTAVAAKKPAAARTRSKTTAKASRPSRTTEPPASTATKGGTTAADRFLDEQRELLLTEREASLRQAESLRAEAEQLAEEMEPGDTQFDEESGEGGTLNVERERDLALSAQARAAADEVDRALAKVDAGTYGTCEQCGQPIPRARLKALPAAALCVACKSGGLSRR
jgi:DnaK suppressor protein